MFHLTPEELVKLKSLQDQMGSGDNLDVPEPDAVPEQTPQARATAPEASVDIPQMDTQSARSQYDEKAREFSDKAQRLEDTAAQPRPQPQGTKQVLISAARTAMESFGKYGAPGGYYGQEDRRQQEFDKQNATKLAQAKEMRDLGQKETALGQTAETNARQENYQQGELNNQRIAEKAREVFQNGQLRNGQDRNQIERDKNANDTKFGPAGSQPFVNGKPTGSPIPKDTPPPKEQRVLWESKPGDASKQVAWAIDQDGNKTHAIGAERATPGYGPGSTTSFVQTTNEKGDAVLGVGDKASGTVKPVTMAGDTTKAPVLTADQGKANARNDAKFEADYAGAASSLKTMEGEMKRGTYAGDQAMADAFFNIIKPGTGARMNESQINRFITPGPLRDKMIVWAQKLAGGQPLDGNARRDLYESAKIVVQNKPRGRAANSGAAPSQGGWSVVH